MKKACWSKRRKQLLTLDEGAEEIRIYSRKLKLIDKVKNNREKHVLHPVLILDCDYDEKEERIGAVNQDSTISF